MRRSSASKLSSSFLWAAIALVLSLAACGGNEESARPPRAAPQGALSVELPKTVEGVYPKTRSVEALDVLFGTAVSDPYRWLEDGKSGEVASWVKEQDLFARAELGKLDGRDALRKRLKELLYVESLGAPRHRGSRYFYSKRRVDDEKAIIYWKEGKGGEEHVLLNPNEWSKDGSSSLGIWRVSPDGKLVAYAVRENNSDEATLFVLDVATGKKLERDTIVGAKYAEPSWTPKGDGFYYTWLPVDPKISPADRPGYAEVRFHELGKDPSLDRIVRERTGDASVFLSAELSHDGHFLFLQIAHGWTSNEIYVKDLRKAKEGPFRPLAVGRDAHFYVDAYRDQLYVLTDDGASNKRAFKVSPDAVAREKWTEIVPERKDSIIESMTFLGGKMVIVSLKNATNRFEVRDLDGKVIRDLELPGLGTVSGPIGRPEDDEIFFSFESFTEAPAIYETSAKAGGMKVFARVRVPFDASPFVTEQIFFPSKDGTRISMFVTFRKDLKRDGTARALLYGYGGFLANEVPLFTASMIPWIEAGGVYAVPNLRGGGEYGEEWHRGGMKLKKQNVFDDFIGAAEALTKEGFTKPARLAIYGASNGGLLVGTVMTQRPELFGAVLCGVPLLDMVRYHLSGGGRTWISEYGTPEKEDEFRALVSYSPYHHVTKGVHYPPLLMLAADSDDRVDPLHARKFVAMMQARSSGGPTLMRVERNSGHGGADLRRAEVEKVADRLAFAMKHTGELPGAQ